MRKGLIVSVQGYSTTTTEELIEQAVNGGTVAIRTDKRVRSGVPVIGLYKRRLKEKRTVPYITCSVEEVEKVSKWAEYVAVDCRPINENLKDIHKYAIENNIKIVADIRTFTDYRYLKDIGFEFDYISTTFNVFDNDEPDINLIEMLVNEGLNVIGEGNYSKIEHVENAFKAGAMNVCIGNAITSVYKLTKRFASVCS